MLNIQQESTFHFKLGHKVNLAFTGQRPVRGCATTKKKGLICRILWALSPFFPRERKWIQEEVEEKRNEISVLYRSVLNFLLHLLFYSCPFFVWHRTFFLFSRLSVWVKCRHFHFIPPQKKKKNQDKDASVSRYPVGSVHGWVVMQSLCISLTGRSTFSAYFNPMCTVCKDVVISVCEENGLWVRKLLYLAWVYTWRWPRSRVSVRLSLQCIPTQYGVDWS